MRKLMIATAAATALLAGASVANAQTFQNDGPSYGSRGAYVERGAGLQIGPIGTYADEPTYSYGYTHRTPDNSTENSRAFQSQEVWPQSPPGGG